ncbi:hypothetical protein OS493_029627 [Desmophyllum pertusum]|uniref:CUB domain-containing protein n=1 Tax=Desmophyllum pertusum TaxID=174260 RepID=A0A9X0D702_9CNID|nr:hypothetical protein OS493_029627 [Desmophyllum pertusum]
MNILLQNSSGVIKTPGYPISYPYKLISQCRWKLIAPEGEMVRLTFLSFQMNIYDSVEITDNVDVWNPYFLTRSGLLPSFTVYSTGRQLGINVNVKVGNTGPGFSAIYSMVPAAVSSGTCNPDKNSTVHMAGEGMSFLTRDFPNTSEMALAVGTSQHPQGSFIRCKKTYAEVFDVTNSTRTFLGKFCFNQDVSEQVVYSKGNNLLVSGTFRQGGFIATYESVKSIPAQYSCLSNCYRQIQLNETSGEFASFNYPLLYPNGARCSWELKAPAGYLIQLTFHSFNLENSQDCKADYVEVRQSESYTWATKVDRFCGSSLPPVMRSKYSKVYVDFVSDRSGGYPGFHASYTVFPDRK